MGSPELIKKSAYVRLELDILKCIDRKNTQVGHIKTRKIIQNGALVAENDHITPERLHIHWEMPRRRLLDLRRYHGGLETFPNEYAIVLM